MRRSRWISWCATSTRPWRSSRPEPSAPTTLRFWRSADRSQRTALDVHADVHWLDHARPGLIRWRPLGLKHKETGMKNTFFIALLFAAIGTMAPRAQAQN